MGKKYYYGFFICLLWLTAGACASLPSQEIINAQLEHTLIAAQSHYDKGQVTEAAILTDAVQRIEPDYEGVSALGEKISKKDGDILKRGILGTNRRLRTKTDWFPMKHLLFYIPDRILDALDIFSFDLHFGLGAFANVHATRAVQVGAGLRSKAGLGWHNQRSLGFAAESEVGVSVLGLGAQSFAGSMAGTSGVFTTGNSLAGLHLPSSDLYQEYRDYWAIGADVTAGLIGVSVDIHPIQIFDLIGGLFLIDFARDDICTTRGLKLTPVEKELLISLSEIERSKLRDKDTSAKEVEEVEKNPDPSEEDKKPGEEKKE
jgi:hypothetical protein